MAMLHMPIQGLVQTEGLPNGRCLGLSWQKCKA